MNVGDPTTAPSDGAAPGADMHRSKRALCHRDLSTVDLSAGPETGPGAEWDYRCLVMAMSPRWCRRRSRIAWNRACSARGSSADDGSSMIGSSALREEAARRGDALPLSAGEVLAVLERAVQQRLVAVGQFEDHVVGRGQPGGVLDAPGLSTRTRARGWCASAMACSTRCSCASPSWATRSGGTRSRRARRDVAR